MGGGWVGGWVVGVVGWGWGVGGVEKEAVQRAMDALLQDVAEKAVKYEKGMKKGEGRMWEWLGGWSREMVALATRVRQANLLVRWRRQADGAVTERMRAYWAEMDDERREEIGEKLSGSLPQATLA